MGFGNFGRIVAESDFLGGYEDITWAATSVDIEGGWYIVSVNEGTIQKVVDEPGGVIQFLTDTADNDNVALISGPFKPADGGVEMECRFKVGDDMANTAIYIGYSETMAQDTPVMPAEFSTTTMTYNGSGGMAGFSYDSNATDNDFRALAGDGGAVSANADADGTRANQTITADEFYVCRVEIDTNGKALMSISHDTDGMEIVKEIESAVTPGDLQYAVIMCENRTGAALEFEIDYARAHGNRDWTN